MVVKIADRQWRYSRFPSLPLLGRAARRNRIETLHAERESLSERFCDPVVRCAETQRLHRRPSAAFIGSHLAVASRGRSGRGDPQTQQPPRASWSGASAHESDNQQNRVQYEAGERGRVGAQPPAAARLNLLADDTLADRVGRDPGNVWTKRRRPRALFSSTVTSWRSWSLLFRCCRAIRSSLSS